MRLILILAAVLTTLFNVGCARVACKADATAMLTPGLHQRTVTLGEQRHPYALFIPEGTPPPRGWPVILFLHGSGERGSDGVKQTTVGLYPAVQKNPERWPAVIVMPQLPVEDPDARAFFVRWRHRTDLALAALDDALAKGTGAGADARRVALTGLSNGGQGAWQLAAEHPERFTRVLPIAASSIVPLPDGQPMLLNGRPLLAPTPSPEEQRRWIASLARQRIWAFHGLADPVVPHVHCETMVSAINAAGGEPPRVRATYLPGVDHNSWDATYAKPDVAEWLVSGKDNNERPKLEWRTADELR